MTSRISPRRRPTPQEIFSHRCEEGEYSDLRERLASQMYPLLKRPFKRFEEQTRPQAYGMEQAGTVGTDRRCQYTASFEKEWSVLQEYSSEIYTGISHRGYPFFTKDKQLAHEVSVAVTEGKHVLMGKQSQETLPNGKYLYVILTGDTPDEERLIMAPDANQISHTCLSMGKPIVYGGEITLEEGRIIPDVTKGFLPLVDTGHYWMPQPVLTARDNPNQFESSPEGIKFFLNVLKKFEKVIDWGDIDICQRNAEESYQEVPDISSERDLLLEKIEDKGIDFEKIRDIGYCNELKKEDQDDILRLMNLDEIEKLKGDFQRTFVLMELHQVLQQYLETHSDGASTCALEEEILPPVEEENASPTVPPSFWRRIFNKLSCRNISDEDVISS